MRLKQPYFGLKPTQFPPQFLVTGHTGSTRVVSGLASFRTVMPPNSRRRGTSGSDLHGGHRLPSKPPNFQADLRRVALPFAQPEV